MLLLQLTWIATFASFQCYLHSMTSRSFSTRTFQSSTSEPKGQDILQVSDTAIALIFSKMADKYMLLDIPGAGTLEMMNCCHSGCDNCEFARVFDCMTSGRPKWVALYPYRKLIDGRDHIPIWAELLYGVTVENHSEIVTSNYLSKQTFFASLRNMKNQACLGVPSIPNDIVESEALSDQILGLFWERLTTKQSINADEVRNDSTTFNFQLLIMIFVNFYVFSITRWPSL